MFQWQCCREGISLLMECDFRRRRSFHFRTPVFNYAKMRCIVLAADGWAEQNISHKPPKPLSMKRLFTSSLEWNGFMMFLLQLLLYDAGWWEKLLPSFFSPKASSRRNFRGRHHDSNCFQEHRFVPTTKILITLISFLFTSVREWQWEERRAKDVAKQTRSN